MNGTKQRVLLGMSGGVDSSVAGYLLREQGYDVVGVTMKVWPQDCISRAEDKCCGPQAIADARGVAHTLGIPHYVVDEADQFERVVIDYFSSEYQAGRTPNPCVMCNEKLKFGSLWEKARSLDCEYIATGHYAIIEHGPTPDADVLQCPPDLLQREPDVLQCGPEALQRRPDPFQRAADRPSSEDVVIRESRMTATPGGNRERCPVGKGSHSPREGEGRWRAILRKGRDPRKDQSYFLFSLRQEQLRRALTPLGEMSKPEIRAIARSLGLKVADKVDSQEICFVPGNDYKAFLRGHLAQTEFHRGGIYDLAGNFLAKHEGIEMFTIGQRKGLPGGSPRPRYVVDIEPGTNRVFVGDAEDLLVEEFEIERLNWSSQPPTEEPLEVKVKIRYSHPGARATLRPMSGDRAIVRLHEPQKAVTPGQAAVCYDGDVVVAGGWICRHAAVSQLETLNRPRADQLA